MRKFTALQKLCNDENVSKEPEATLIAAIEKEVRILKGDVGECKSLLQQVINNQAKSNILIQELQTQKDTRLNFLIKSLDELNKVNEAIGMNPGRYVAVMENILGQRKYFAKRFTNIISGDVVLKLNYDGVKNMKPFKDFKYLNNALFQILQTEGYDEKSYASDVRNAIKLVKGQHFKKQSLLKKSKN